MAAGESLFLVAPPGLGKTTMAQRLARGLIGLDGSELLGYPITPTDKPVVYVAADRPRQGQRSLKRMTTEADRAKLNEMLYVHAGPLPFNIVDDQKTLASWATHLDAGTLIIDSLGYVAVDLVKDETGSRVNNAFANVVAAGIELIVLHHQRKIGRGDTHPTLISDVYGSQWFTAGAGSVLYLEGRASDPIFQVKHFKSPAAEVGPLTVTIDHQAGQIDLHRHGGDDLLLYLRNAPKGLTVAQAAELLYGANPRAADKEKTRRKLEGYLPDLAHKVDGSRGGSSDQKKPTKYYATTLETDPPNLGGL
jgi:replicative DNA helicase